MVLSPTPAFVLSSCLDEPSALGLQRRRLEGPRIPAVFSLQASCSHLATLALACIWVRDLVFPFVYVLVPLSRT